MGKRGGKAEIIRQKAKVIRQKAKVIRQKASAFVPMNRDYVGRGKAKGGNDGIMEKWNIGMMGK